LKSCIRAEGFIGIKKPEKEVPKKQNKKEIMETIIKNDYND
jgi:hypothetical protein